MKTALAQTETRTLSYSVVFTRNTWRRIWANKSARTGLVVGIFFIGLITIVPLISPHHPDEQNLDIKLSAPNRTHILGTDQFGRDVLTRIAVGGRRSLGAALLVLSVTLVLSVGLGLAVGMSGGIVDSTAMRVIDVLLALPSIVFTLAIVGVLGVGFGNLLIALIVSSLASYTRLARSYAASARHRPDIIVARLTGISGTRIVFGHVVPGVLAQMLIVATLDLGGTITSLSGLSFLGLGAQPPAAEWGAMLAEARLFFATAPWLLLAPAGAIFLSVISANLIGNALRDAEDVK